MQAVVFVRAVAVRRAGPPFVRGSHADPLRSGQAACDGIPVHATCGKSRQGTAPVHVSHKYAAWHSVARAPTSPSAWILLRWC